MSDKPELCDTAELLELLRGIESVIDTLRAMAVHATASYVAAHAAQAEKEITNATSH
jgi:hypothetical protein